MVVAGNISFASAARSFFPQDVGLGRDTRFSRSLTATFGSIGAGRRVNGRSGFS